MKIKIIAALLAALTIVGIMSTVSFADSGESEIYTAFADKQIDQKNDYVDEFGMEVRITSYADSAVKSNDSLIVYVINHMGEYPGTESDTAIIADYLAEGYVVTLLDYKNAPLSVSPNIEKSILTIRTAIKDEGSYIGDRSISPYYTYVLPAGYRLARGVEFFDITTHSSQSALNSIVSRWNSNTSLRKKVYNTLGSDYVTQITNADGTVTYEWTNGEAKTVYDIVKTDGTNMTDDDLKYEMDIVYPSKPTKETPVAVLASSSAYRNTVGRGAHTGFLFRGYTLVCYDHEYVPYMSYEKGGWGHFDTNYTLQNIDGVKTHTAVVRAVKYHADIYGYSKDKIGVYGHSKASWSSLLSNPNAEELAEDWGKYPPMNEQPYLTDINGNPLDSSITCSYHSMGLGSKRFETYLTSLNVPTMICNGQKDTGTGNSYWEDEKAAYRESGIEFIAVDMIDGGHNLPDGIDRVYNYDMYLAFCKFFDYYLKDTASEILYTSVNEGQLKELVTTPEKYSSTSTKWSIIEGNELFVQFVAPVTEWSFAKATTLTDSKGNVIEGKWYAQGNGNRWIFDGALTEGETYTLSVEDNAVSDKYGRTVEKGITVTFVK